MGTYDNVWTKTDGISYMEIYNWMDVNYDELWMKINGMGLHRNSSFVALGSSFYSRYVIFTL